jgi:SAM-dependent methyltransferase
MDGTSRKGLGAYYTPDYVCHCLVRWAARSAGERMLDPACGDGRFLAAHPNSVGVETDAGAVAAAGERAPDATVHRGDFFEWAGRTEDRFECAAGNPPFIRYQRFSGEVRRRALGLCVKHGACFSRLTSSWGPFIVGAATVLKPGGRMAFVVPAEIGHAPYAQPVLEYLAAHFAVVQVVAVREKLFPDLSEDCWLLYCEGYGGQSRTIRLSVLDRFAFSAAPPRPSRHIDLDEWRRWNGRLRPFLLPARAREFYRAMAEGPSALRLGDVASVSIGYVTGDNDFFHLRLSEAERLNLPHRFLRPTVRNGKYLRGSAITTEVVRKWLQRDEAVLLLSLGRGDAVPAEVRHYLDSPQGQAARRRFKCRTRSPWYAVPNVVVPEAFLSYMTSGGPVLVANEAKCAATNSVHVVRLHNGVTARRLLAMWAHPLTRLSCEVEGHPLGGGLLKIEPGEAARVLLCRTAVEDPAERRLIRDGLRTMHRWRHHG